MAINTITCKDCGSRINYIVNSKQDTQTIECKRCHTPNDVLYSNVSNRIKEVIKEQEDMSGEDSIFYDDDSFLDDSYDNVEESLDQADEIFKEATASLNDLDKILQLNTDILSIADEYEPDYDDYEEEFSVKKHPSTKHQREESSYKRNTSCANNESKVQKVSSKVEEFWNHLSDEDRTNLTDIYEQVLDRGYDAVDYEQYNDWFVEKIWNYLGKKDRHRLEEAITKDDMNKLYSGLADIVKRRRQRRRGYSRYATDFTYQT